MGCTVSNLQTHNPAYAYAGTKVGKLVITLKSIKLNREFAFGLNSCFYGKLSLSHIQKKTQIYSIKDLNNSINERFEFCINSCYKIHGRALTIEIFDGNYQSQTQICCGLADLDPYLTSQTLKEHQTKVYLYNQNRALGYCQFNIKFEQYTHKKLNIRINSLFLRKNIETYGLYAVRIVAGQEIIETRPKKISTDCIPSWKNQILKLKIPSFLKQIKMEIIDLTYSEEIHGIVEINDEQLQGEIMHNKHIKLNGKIIGNIIFDSAICDNGNFNNFQQHAVNYKADYYEHSCAKNLTKTYSTIGSSTEIKNKTLKSENSVSEDVDKNETRNPQVHQ